MINIFINQISKNIAVNSTVLQLINLIKPMEPFALAINLQFIPKSAYKTTILCAMDAVEIVHPISGG